MTEISWQDFEKIDLRIGTIENVEEFLEAKKPAYKLWINLGELGVKQSSAQITEKYAKEDLIGKQVLCVCNFPKKQIAHFMSEVLTTGFIQKEGVILATADSKVKNGTQLR